MNNRMLNKLNKSPVFKKPQKDIDIKATLKIVDKKSKQTCNNNKHQVKL